MNYDKELIRLIKQLQDRRIALEQATKAEASAFEELRSYLIMERGNGNRDLVLSKALEQLGKDVLAKEGQ